MADLELIIRSGCHLAQDPPEYWIKGVYYHACQPLSIFEISYSQAVLKLCIFVLAQSAGTVSVTSFMTL